VRDIRTILRLTHEQGLSVREVAERLKIGKTSVSTYLLRAREAGLSCWPLPASFDDDAALEQRLFHRMGRPPQDLSEPDWARVARILFTSSASGIYGNFGQTNYGAAKAAMIGLMNVLHIEGAKYDIRVNTLAPTPTIQMTVGLISEEEAALLAPEFVTPAVLYLVGDDAPSRMIMGAGAGCSRSRTSPRRKAFSCRKVSERRK
jgi:NAD(P)-dependent dehydrogenase (short-subunit alcohol dehydrogenase family)